MNTSLVIFISSGLFPCWFGIYINYFNNGLKWGRTTAIRNLKGRVVNIRVEQELKKKLEKERKEKTIAKSTLRNYPISWRRNKK